MEDVADVDPAVREGSVARHWNLFLSVVWQVLASLSSQVDSIPIASR